MRLNAADQDVLVLAAPAAATAVARKCRPPRLRILNLLAPVHRCMAHWLLLHQHSG